MLSGADSPGGARAVARCRELGAAPYSDMEGGLYRAYLAPAYHAAQRRLAEWMQEAGMTIRTDAAANLIGRYEGVDPDAPALVIGSHLDSVRDGGCFDGPLGIMLGVELVAALNAAGRRLPFPIEVYAFGDEEGSRFSNAMLTSRAVAGILDRSELDIADGDGVALADAGVDVDQYLSAQRTPGSTLAYFETHIEQGPVLEAENLAVGTVSGIYAQLRYIVEVRGMAGHAGTVTMKYRQDALAGAAEMIGAVERHAQANQANCVATVGRIEARPGAPNVIAGAATFTLDIRSLDEELRNDVAAAIEDELYAIAARRGLAVEVNNTLDLPASPCDERLKKMLDQALIDNGQRYRRLASGAGHDAMNFTGLCPVAMLFMRCKGGISHNPAEDVDPDDAGIALRVMLSFVEKLGEDFVAA